MMTTRRLKADPTQARPPWGDPAANALKAIYDGRDEDAAAHLKTIFTQYWPNLSVILLAWTDVLIAAAAHDEDPEIGPEIEARIQFVEMIGTTLRVWTGQCTCGSDHS